MSIGGASIPILKNLVDLRKSAEAFCKVHSGKVDPPITANPFEFLHSLYKSMLGCCPEHHSINIDYDTETNRLVFVEYASCDYPQYTLAFIPLCRLKGLPYQIRKFLIEIFSLIKVTMQVASPMEHWDFAYALGEFDAEFVEEEINENEDYRVMVEVYRNGYIKEVIDEIDRTPWSILTTSDVADRIEVLLTLAPNPTIRKIVEVAAKGIPLMINEDITTYQNSLMRCNLKEFDDSDYEDQIMSVQRMIAFCYDHEDADPVTAQAVNFIDNDGYSIMQEELYESKIITPDYSSPFHTTDFPKKWFAWFEEFSKALNEYEPTE